MIAIAIESLSAGVARVIQHLNFRADVQSLHIRGRVGSGKTLLARALCGDFAGSDIYKVVGTATFGSLSLRLPLSSARRDTYRLAYVPQDTTNFFVTNKVGDEFFASVLGVSKSSAELRRAVQMWVGETALGDRLEVPPLALSGGQQRILALEVAIASDPDVLVFDGGFETLDEAFRVRAQQTADRWLRSDPNHRLIYLSLPNSPPWFEFPSTLDLDSGSGATNAISEAVPTQPGKEVLRYSDVMAGPRISGVPLLNKISFSVRQGEFVAIEGVNGIGKSTLLRLLAGMVPVFGGSITFDGRRLDEVQWPGVKGGVGYLPQEPELAGPYARRELSTKLDVSRAEWKRWRDFLSLDWEGDWDNFWTMSAGERVRASLLVQLIQSPRFWMLDEPTTRMDSVDAAAIVSEIRKEQPNVAGLLISHSTSFLKATCDRHMQLTANGIVL